MTWKVMTILIMALILFMGLSFMSCAKEEGPMAPSGVTTMEPISMPSTSSPPATPNVPADDNGIIGSVTGMFSGRAIGKVTNGPREEDFILACYANPTGDIENQFLLEYKHELLQPGESTRMTIKLPQNQEGETCAVQCDLASDRKTPKIPPFYHRDELVAFGEAGSGECVPDVPPCVDCTPETCEKPEDPSSEGWECQWFEDLCRWGCKCVPTEEPECEQLIWDYASCSYVGGCLCEPEGKSECPEQTWDTELCKWVGECENGCDVVGEPECPEQTWDKEKCKWVGECPKECEKACDFGYELDEDKCECIGLPICHVSNKGKDGDWNIQESQKTYNPGHGSHFNDCPPDYLGTCDGRFNEGAPCQGSEK